MWLTSFNTNQSPAPYGESRSRRSSLGFQRGSSQLEAFRRIDWVTSFDPSSRRSMFLRISTGLQRTGTQGRGSRTASPAATLSTRYLRSIQHGLAGSQGIATRVSHCQEAASTRPYSSQSLLRQPTTHRLSNGRPRAHSCRTRLSDGLLETSSNQLSLPSIGQKAFSGCWKASSRVGLSRLSTLVPGSATPLRQQRSFSTLRCFRSLQRTLQSTGSYLGRSKLPSSCQSLSSRRLRFHRLRRLQRQLAIQFTFGSGERAPKSD